jgi:hypothetical protein
MTGGGTGTVADRSPAIAAALRNRFFSSQRLSGLQVTSPSSVLSVTALSRLIPTASTLATRILLYVPGSGFSSNPTTRSPSLTAEAGLQVKSAIKTGVSGFTPRPNWPDARGVGVALLRTLAWIEEVGELGDWVSPRRDLVVNRVLHVPSGGYRYLSFPGGGMRESVPTRKSNSRRPHCRMAGGFRRPSGGFISPRGSTRIIARSASRAGSSRPS